MDLTAPDIARAEFRTVRKGFDPEQVRRFAEGVAERVQRLEDRLAALEAEAPALLEQATADAAAVRDEAERERTAGREAAEAEVAALRAAADDELAQARVAAEAEAATVTREAAEAAAVVEARAGERAEAIVAKAVDEAAAVAAAAEAEADERRRRAVDEASAAAEAEKARHRDELELLATRVVLLRQHVVDLERLLDRQEAAVDRLDLYAGEQRRRLAVAAASLQHVLDDPSALGGVVEQSGAAPIDLRELLAPPPVAVPLEEPDVADLLAGVADPPAAAEPDTDLVQRFFEEGVFADERWMPRKDRRRAAAKPAPPAPAPAATIRRTGDDGAITPEPPEERVS